MLLQKLLRRLLFMFLVSIAVVFFVALALSFRNSPGVADDLRLAAVLNLLRGTGQMALAFSTGLWHGDLGVIPTRYGEESINDILWFSFANSMGLLLMALALATVTGLWLGVFAALTQRRRRRYAFLFFSFLGVSAPSFFLAVVFQQGGILYTRTFGRRLVSMGGYAWDFDHLILPLLVLAARPTAYIARASYVSLLEVMRQDYIRAAFARGFSLRRTVITQAMRNIAVPVLTSIGLSLRFSLSALPIVEFIFAWPGVGRRILQGINEQVPMLVIAIALLLGLLLQLVNLFLDLTYVAADPRLRQESQP